MTRWVISPVIAEIMSDGRTHRFPKLAEKEDLGRPRTISLDDPIPGESRLIIPRFGWSAAISDGQPGQINDWCLCFVRGVDFSAIDTDIGISTLLELVPGLLDKTPDLENWPNRQFGQFRGKLVAKGVATSEVRRDRPLGQMLQVLGRIVQSQFSPRGTFVAGV